jgi:hypothetical protein
MLLQSVGPADQTDADGLYIWRGRRPYEHTEWNSFITASVEDLPQNVTNSGSQPGDMSVCLMTDHFYPLCGPALANLLWRRTKFLNVVSHSSVHQQMDTHQIR